ncbi:proteasome activator complex subunit 2 [Pleuronectes platessa]|uniref:proteasome activator complex subunit 2 n=1 Tax=Pleuronectes platessa TaxID=8262 RepID=UPI00232A271E|nr:proteasome activator complex subunit 2 [Pleuronectes platessa]
MSKASRLRIRPEAAGKVEKVQQHLHHEAEKLFSTVIPLKISQLDALLQDDALNVDASSLLAPLDIPIPDPPSAEEEMETDKDEEGEKKKAPRCGFIKGNEKVMSALDKVRPEIVAFRGILTTVSCWIQHLIPKIEDGNDFGVVIQEKILERIAAVKTHVDAFQTNINKYFSERGDAVAKASKNTHVMDYRSLVHDKDDSIYAEIKVIVLDLRGFYVEIFDIVNKNLDKVTNPKGEEKPSMY